VAGDGAVVEHCKLQRESEKAYHVATLQAHLSRSAHFASHAISLGGALARNDINAVLDAEGIECILNGLYLTQGSQHIDNHTFLDHAKPHCSSREYYKGVLPGRSHGVFNGKILVRKDAQKTDAKQTNKNLLLSEEALVDTKPQLEIYADDVRCTHGATIGQLDEDALFYLRSRGLGQEDARSLLIHAFATDLIERIPVLPVPHRAGVPADDPAPGRHRAEGGGMSGHRRRPARGSPRAGRGLRRAVDPPRIPDPAPGCAREAARLSGQRGHHAEAQGGPGRLAELLRAGQRQHSPRSSTS
jgi:FeS assembly protein SufD